MANFNNMVKKIFKAALEDKVCLITGGAGLLGKKFSLALAEAQAKLIITDIDAAKGEKLKRQIKQATGNREVFFRQSDITDVKAVNKLMAEIKRKFGRLDALINCAYPMNKNYGRKFETVTYADFCDSLNKHLGGYFLMCQRAAALMKIQRQGGVMINLGSIYGSAAPRFEIYKGTTMTVPPEYAAIKGGIINLTRYLASYLGKYNIRVNSLSPGGLGESNMPKSFVKAYEKKVLLGGRMAEFSDLTGALVFLASDASKYLTGQDIVVDGGWSL